MKELLAKPGFMVQTGTLGADLSYLLAVVFTTLFLVAWYFAKTGQRTRHHKLVFVSMVSMVVYFLGYYYARSLGVLAAEGKEGFGGPQNIYDNVFLPILYTHLTLVTVGLILAPYMIVLGFRACAKVNGDWVLQEGELKADPSKFKRLYLWILGIWLLTQIFLWVSRDDPFGAMVAYTLVLGVIALVISLEKLVERLLPDGARRHRLLGRFTMGLFAVILVTSTATYLLLYVIYPVKPAVG